SRGRQVQVALGQPRHPGVAAARDPARPSLSAPGWGASRGRGLFPRLPAARADRPAGAGRGRVNAAMDLLEPTEDRPGEGTPELSVLMPLYNSARIAGDAVASVLRQEGCIAEILI